MNYKKTNAIILKRINYGEADKIITALTSDYGKLCLLAKGVRKSTSKLAGGIELFSESSIQFIKGRGDIDTLVSARINRNFSKISKNLKATNSGYEIIAVVNEISEHNADSAHYSLLKNKLNLLDEGYDELMVLGIFYAKVLEISGHSLNLSRDISGNDFIETKKYNYNFDAGGFEETFFGNSGSTIKVIKLLFNQPPHVLVRITGMEQDLNSAVSLLKSLVDYYLHIKRKY